jgi:hypothetical protein
MTESDGDRTVMLYETRTAIGRRRSAEEPLNLGLGHAGVYKPVIPRSRPSRWQWRWYLRCNQNRATDGTSEQEQQQPKQGELHFAVFAFGVWSSQHQTADSMLRLVHADIVAGGSDASANAG